LKSGDSIEALQVIERTTEAILCIRCILARLTLFSTQATKDRKRIQRMCNHKSR